MKSTKWVKAFKIGLIIILFCSFLYFVVEQRNEQMDEEYAPTADYKNGNNVTQVIPGGVMTGIYAETSGVLVLGTGNISTSKGDVTSPAEGVIKKGDYIVACNGKELSGKEELIDFVQNCEGNELQFVIRREEKEIEVYITPCYADGEYCMGVWVRDDIAGIGMITYVTTQLDFGALGHGITDMDLGIEMDIHEGTVHDARLTNINIGESGKPGQLIGYINYRANQPKGYIYQNSNCGIKGELKSLPNELEEVSYVSLGSKEDVKRGEALLICDVSGKREVYSIEIEKIYSVFPSDNKNFTIHVTDERLLEITGGIVQGMSGAPIIQDGKLIGAVTHVLVNDPTRGYGIFIETMMEN